MTEEQKLSLLKAMIDTDEEDVSDETLSAYLYLAGRKIMKKRYPFHTDKTEVPEKYQALQVEIACYLINKRGAEGETTHSENGISRSYESASVPSSMLDGVIPVAKPFSFGGDGV